MHSPSQLVKFFKSPYQAYIEKYHNVVDQNYAQQDKDDPLDAVLANKGYKHEEELYQSLKNDYPKVAQIDTSDKKRAIKKTEEFIKEGFDVIYQGALTNNHFFGFTDFLIKVPGQSKFGNYSYEVWDAKLSKTTKPEYLIQLCCYAEMLCELIECDIPKGVIFLGKGIPEKYDLKDFYSFYSSLRDVYLNFEQSKPSSPPDPELFTNWGKYSEHAKKILESKNHLSQIANIRKTQIKLLNESGITTIDDLIAEDSVKPIGMDQQKFLTLKTQAQLQQESKNENTLKFRVINIEDEHVGLASLPPKSKNDIYFDLESNPLNKDFVLHYLWGVAHEDDASRFKSWWCHDDIEMKEVFEAFVDWTYDRWLVDPHMRVYHYGNFEIAALKELMSKFGTKENEVDNLLRNNVFIDLLKVVKNGMIIGADGYGLKKIEPLYRSQRIDEVQSGNESTVQYENWMDSNEGKDEKSSNILKEIWDYNREDCISLIDLCNFLRKQQEKHQISYLPPIDEVVIKEPTEKELKIKIILDNKSKDEALPHKELLTNLCLYHARENKPVYWRYFERIESTDEELVEDLDCLGNLTFTGKTTIIKRSKGFEYRFDPFQDSKLKKNDQVRIKQDTTLRVTIEELDLEEGICLLKTTAPSLPAKISLIPSNVVTATNIEDNILAVTEEYQKSGKLRPCLNNLLDRTRPYLKVSGADNFSEWGSSLADIAINVTKNLNQACLCIQGPPGTGKTTIGSQVITELASMGYKIGITSNSHKAIDNLIERVLKNNRLVDKKMPICRVSTKSEPFYEENDEIDVYSAASQINLNKQYHIFGGTAWAFAHENFKDQLDFLFVDEAGQVSLANLVGISQSCKNIILMGDQMQLAQPTMGAHPLSSGLSCLEYLLEGNPTIPLDKGIFLKETYRLHPDICQFISRRIYEDRLIANEKNTERKLFLKDGSMIKSSGIQYVQLEHEGNEQASKEEVLVIKALVDELLQAELHDGDTKRSITKDDILIVSPFNHQIRNLQDAFKSKIEIGTVDKFQGREAAIVIISMASSDTDSTPRGTSFLFEKNRLNVAITRAKSLAIIVGSKNLEKTTSQNLKEIAETSFYLDLLNYADT